MSNLDKQTLRQQLRERRRQLGAAEQREASLRLDVQLRQQPAFANARHIAFYLANDGEISPRPSLRRLARQYRQCYLPCLNGQALLFRRYRPGQTLQRNRYGIPEPSNRRGNQRPVEALDIILLPLVGFDRSGNRLGMGGGFYDRSLAQLKQRPRQHRPLLIGLAHECQRVNQLPVQSWDIPLDGIATDRGVYWFGRGVKR